MSRTDLSQYNNDWYRRQIGGSALRRGTWYFVNLLILRSGYNPFSRLIVLVLRLYGAKIGKGVVIKPGVSVKYPWKLSIGAASWIGEQVWIDNLAEVSIGEHACVSQGAMLLTGNHDYTTTAFNLMVRPIVIEDGAWIGAKAVVCPGVHVKSHAILAVNSVANRDLEAYGIYQGNPAVQIKQRQIK